MQTVSPTNTPQLDQPDLVSLVVQSKKALQHGELLCSRASDISSISAQSAVDVLALDAKVRWMTDAVLEQLKLAAQVARNIEQKRSHLEKEAEEWDKIRNRYSNALDTVLESLGAQVVPVDFYARPMDESVFRSNPASDSEDETNPSPFRNGHSSPAHSPAETVRNLRRHMNGTPNGSRSHEDRSTWKTLRDFVDEHAIDEVLDRIESDRNELDDILARTLDYPESLSKTISAIRDDIPAETPLPSLEEIFSIQEGASVKMADLLEGLAAHYDQMLRAMRDHDAGERFSEQDIQEMVRDAQELPAIISELEESCKIIETAHSRLGIAKEAAQEHLDIHRKILDDLDELGDIISEMLERQRDVEIECVEHLQLLHHHLATVEDLHHRYTSYQYSYNKLLLELGRRRHWHEAAENIVRGMLRQLDSMAEEEFQARDEFNAVHSRFLPEDVCLYLQNPPTRWTIKILGEESGEVLPIVAPDLLDDARRRISDAGDVGVTQQST